MDTRKIQALIQTAKCGSINKAAEQLGYTSSGLTYLLNTLETELSVSLLQRGRNGVQLTSEAHSLLPYMENILKAEKVFDQQVLRKRSQDHVIRIGCFSSVAVSWFPPVINEFRQLYPDMAIDLKIGNMSILSMLENDEVEIGIVDENIRGDFEWEFLQDDYICAYMPKDHPLASRESLSIRDLEQLPCIFPSYESRDFVSALWGDQSMNFKTRLSVNTISGSDILQLVRSGLGVTFLSHLCAAECPPDIRIVPIEPAIVRPLGIIKKQNRILSPQMQHFLKMLKGYLGG